MRAFWYFLALLLLGACSEQSVEGRIILVVDAEADLATQLTRVDVTGATSTASFWLRDPPSGQPAITFPFSLELRGPGPKTVRVVGFVGDEQRVVRLATLDIPAGRQATYGFLLSSACVREKDPCLEQQGQTCDCGGCVPIEVAGPLARLSGESDAVDAYLAAPLVCGVDMSMQDPDESPMDDGGVDGDVEDDEDGAVRPDVPDAQVAGSLSIDGPLVIAAGRCRPFTLRRQDGEQAGTAAMQAPTSLVLASDSQCTQPITSISFGAGQTEQTFYVRPAPLDAGEHTREVTFSVTSDAALEVTLDVRRAAVSIAGGTNAGCALLDDLTMQCWGSGAFDRLTTDATYAAVPVQTVGVPTLHAGASLVTNGVTNYLVDQGSVYAWGANEHGQLGRGVADWSRYAIGLVPGLSGVTQFSSGYFHACAVKGGDVYCWGWNPDHEVDEGTADVPSPKLIASLPDGQVAMVVASDYHNCALLKNGELRCWGGNNYGQLGDGTQNGSATPVVVDLPGSGIATQVWAELSTTCALVDEELYCWGEGYNLVPTLVATTHAPIEQVQPSTRGILCLRSQGKVYCSGDNRGGWLGTGASSESLGTLTEVPLPGYVERLEMSYEYGPTFTALVDGVVYTWGLDAGWSLGTTPVAGCLSTPRPTTLFDAFEIAQGSMRVDDDTGCAVRADSGAVHCWGSGGQGMLGRANRNDGDTLQQVLGLDGGATQLFLGRDHVIAARDGKVCGWGENGDGQIGLGHRSGVPNMASANVLPTTSKVTAVTAGEFFSCALVEDSGADDGVFCWGIDVPSTAGSLGDAADHAATDYHSLSAVRVYAASAEVTDLQSAGGFSCVAIDGGVQCWGDRAASPVPVSVAGLEPGAGHGIVDVELAWPYSCARSSSGDVYCWEGVSTASKVAISGVQQLRVGDAIACGLTSEQRLYCWNLPGTTNACGELGLGDTLARSTPTRLTTLTEPVYDFALHDRFACARDAQGWKCWGNQRTHRAGFTPWIVNSAQPLYDWASSL